MLTFDLNETMPSLGTHQAIPGHIADASGETWAESQKSTATSSYEVFSGTEGHPNRLLANRYVELFIEAKGRDRILIN